MLNGYFQWRISVIIHFSRPSTQLVCHFPILSLNIHPNLSIWTSCMLTDLHVSFCLLLPFRLHPKPQVLIGHFFAVAIYAIYFNFKNGPLWQLPLLFYKSASIFYKACGVIFPLIWSEVRIFVRVWLTLEPVELLWSFYTYLLYKHMMRLYG